MARIDKREPAREAQLKAHQTQQYQSHEADRGCGHRILDRNDFRILRKDVLCHPSLCMVEFDVFDFGRWDRPSWAKCGIGHENALLRSFPLIRSVLFGVDLYVALVVVA